MLKFECACGNVPQGIVVGTTSDFNLVAMWTCGACQKEMVAFMPLEKLVAGVPEHPAQTIFSSEDASVLLAMKISL